MGFLRSIVLRFLFPTAWAESLEGSLNGHQSLAILCRYRCRLLPAEVLQTGPGRNTELKPRPQPWEAGEVHDLVGRILGQQHTRQQRREEKTMQPQTQEQRGKRACALIIRGSISKAMKGLVGWSSRGARAERGKALD